MRSSLILTIIFGIALFIQGCGAYTGRGPVIRVAEETNRVVYKDFASKVNFGVVDLKKTRLEGGQLKVGLKIENWRNKNLWCELQTVFKDNSGFEIEKTNFKPVLFKRRQVTHYETNSISKKAEDFNVIIRRK